MHSGTLSHEIGNCPYSVASGLSAKGFDYNKKTAYICNCIKRNCFRLMKNVFHLMVVSVFMLTSCHDTEVEPEKEGMKVNVMVEEVWCCKVKISATVDSPYTLDNSTFTVRIEPENKSMNGFSFLDLKTSTVYDGKMYVITGSLSPNQKYLFTTSLVQRDVTYDSEQQSFTTSDLPTDLYVDMGVSVKWASHNIGASKPDEEGLRFAWGEVDPKGSYSIDNYKWYSQNQYTKYNENDGLRILQPGDDAATTILGSQWHTPTHDEVIELVEACDWMWVYYGNTRGLAATSRTTGKTLFFPSILNESYGIWSDVYWTSSVLYSDVNYLNIDSSTFADAVCMRIQNGFAGSGISQDDSIFHGLTPGNGATDRISRYNSAVIRSVSK